MRSLTLHSYVQAQLGGGEVCQFQGPSALLCQPVLRKGCVLSKPSDSRDPREGSGGPVPSHFSFLKVYFKGRMREKERDRVTSLWA